jgi:hypothetical protein
MSTRTRERPALMRPDVSSTAAEAITYAANSTSRSRDLWAFQPGREWPAVFRCGSTLGRARSVHEDFKRRFRAGAA